MPAPAGVCTDGDNVTSVADPIVELVVVDGKPADTLTPDPVSPSLIVD